MSNVEHPRSVPAVEMPADAPPIVEVNGLAVHFPISGRSGFGRRQVVHAVDGVSFSIRPGETLGLVGESGSGKSTTGRAILRRVPITAGSVRFQGEDITTMAGERLRRLRRNMQLVYQDPFTSLNPRMRVRQIIAEPMLVNGIGTPSERNARVDELIELTGLPADAADRYPHAFSGGQRQRIGIARALSAEPKLIIADEPVSALDVSIQAQVVTLLQRIQRELGVAFLFIAHDLSVVRHISHRIGIMYAGQLVELADGESIFTGALHPYTESLLSALPIPDPDIESSRSRIVLSGEVPNPIEPPSGCRFHTRCPYVQPDRCATEPPALREVVPGHLAACHFAEDIAAGLVVRRTESVIPVV